MRGHAPTGKKQGDTAPVIAVFGSSLGHPGESGYEEARACGRLLAEAGYGVATGGYAGTMEACSRGASEAGGRVVGVTAPGAFPQRPGANAWVGEELPAATITERLHTIMSVSAASITLEGSIGTLTELLVAWKIAYIARLAGLAPKPALAIGPSWARIVPDLAAAIDTDASLVTLVPDVAAAVAVLRRSVPVPSRSSATGS